jgi:Domain of unknown function (DUF4314)
MKAGDRIRLDHMGDDPNPIPSGSLGTVLSVVNTDWHTKGQKQVMVKWDNGRSLSLVIPPDRATVIKSA